MTRIYFGTNRELLPEGSPQGFGSRFSPDGLSNLRFGRAEVTGDELDQIDIRVASENLFVEPPVLGSQQVFQAVRREMLMQGEDSIIFIHGFNTSFREALRQAAQLHRILTRPDGLFPDPLRLTMCVFSWPSDGSFLLTNPRSRDVVAYKNDRLDAAASGVAFARGFLKIADFVNAIQQEEQCTCRLHLLTHSMGTYVLRYALQEIRKHTGDRALRLFDQILLMAADEDDDAFEHDFKLRLLPRLTRQISVYFNRNDLALWASDNLKGNPARLGTDGPMQPLQLPRNVFPIDCTQAIADNGNPAEHSYFLNVERVIADMRQVLQNQPVDEIPGRTYIPVTNRYRLMS